MDKIVKEQHFLLCKGNIPEYVDLIMKDISEMDDLEIILDTDDIVLEELKEILSGLKEVI